MGPNRKNPPEIKFKNLRNWLVILTLATVLKKCDCEAQSFEFVFDFYWPLTFPAFDCEAQSFTLNRYTESCLENHTKKTELNLFLAGFSLLEPLGDGGDNILSLAGVN